MPFVILSLNEATNMYLVVGVPCPTAFGEIERNTFSETFKDAAVSCGAHFKHDGFDSSIIEINRDDCKRFIDAMHYTLEQR